MSISDERLAELIEQNDAADQANNQYSSYTQDERDTAAALRELISLRAEVAGLRVDAERYRCLKRLVRGQKGTLRVGFINSVGEDRLVMAVVMECADEFIDAEIARQQSTDGGK